MNRPEVSKYSGTPSAAQLRVKQEGIVTSIKLKHRGLGIFPLGTSTAPAPTEPQLN